VAFLIEMTFSLHNLRRYGQMPGKSRFLHGVKYCLIVLLKIVSEKSGKMYAMS